MMNVCLKNGLVEPIINLCFRTDLSHQELIGEITDDDEKVQDAESKARQGEEGNDFFTMHGSHVVIKNGLCNHYESTMRTFSR